MKGIRISFILFLSLLVFLLPIAWYIGIVSLRKPLYQTRIIQSGLFLSKENTSEATNSLYRGLLATKKIEFPSAGIVLTENEQIHMMDVSQLLHWNFVLCIALLSCFLLSLLYLYRTNQWSVMRTSTILASLVFVLILGVGLFSFDALFTLFHQVVFRNNLWLLPQDSILLRLFPAKFFFDQFIGIVLTAFMWFILLIIGSYRLIKGESIK